MSAINEDPFLLPPLFFIYMQELKLKYYKLMIELCQHDHNYLAICQHYRAMFDTPRVQQDEATWKDVREDLGNEA